MDGDAIYPFFDRTIGFNIDEPYGEQFQTEDAGYSCPQKPALRAMPRSGGTVLESSSTKTIANRTAQFRQWRVACNKRTGVDGYDTVPHLSARYTERIWYFVKQKVLIVDEWSTPNLEIILEGASWR
jgi:hypothetical protein